MAKAVLITGTVGSGKTVTAVALGRLLAGHRLPSAVVDLDWLGWTHLGPGSAGPDELISRNLAAVWSNLIAAGVRYGVLTRAITSASALQGIRSGLPGVELQVVRLVAAAEVVEQRLRDRDRGGELEEHLGEAATMAAAMDSARLEDFTIRSDGPDPDRVAASILTMLAWID